MTDNPKISAQATQQEVADIVASFKEGQSIDGFLLLDAASKIDDLVEQGALITKPLILGDDLLFVQPDGTIIGLLDGAKADVALNAENLTIPAQNIVAVALQQGAWTTVADAVEVDLVVLSTTVPVSRRGSGEETQVLPGDPLNGLPISPLLPPTEYTFPELRERDVGGDGGVGAADILFSLDPILLVEIDAALGLRLSDFIRISAGGAADGEEITNVTVSLPNLPVGTTANGGTFSSDGVTEGFTFSGTLAQFEALVISFPADFSTERRSDVASGDLTGTVTATSSFIGDPASFDFPVTVQPEGDLEFVSNGDGRQPETDAPVIFVLSEVLTPRASDADGSEVVNSVSLDLTGLPPGALMSTDGGQTFLPVGTDYSFSGTLADYELLQVQLPADFSTTNPASSINGTLQATTDEGATDTGLFQLEVDATPDIVIAPPQTITAVEDGDGIDGGGVTVDLDLDIRVEDTDGSEDATTVEIVFTDLPAGTVFADGTFTATTGTWTGTLAQANALTLQLPGDYSGTIASVITATNIEGSQTATQDIVVVSAADVDVLTPDIRAVETDAPLVINPAASWIVSISDGDAGQPPEILQSVTLTLNGLPPGVLVQTTQGATVSYDPVAGGVFSFTGTPAQYDLLRLVFPEDYSTEGLPGDALSGTISGTSNEGVGTPVPVTLIIEPEGDAELTVLPLDALDESEVGQVVLLGQIMSPQVSDADGSEAIESIAVTITGLPSINFDLTNTTGFPPGTVSLGAAADGTQTLTAIFDTADVGDVRTAFNAATFELPADFSTANRSDLGGATTLPISVVATLTTDEDNDLGVDGPADGQVTAQAFVTVAAVEDIDLTLPITISADEDNGVLNNADGVRVPLQIAISVTDDDGSETEASGSPFSATVSVEFTDLPVGADVTTGVLTGTTWTGTVADARNLALDLPGNYAGTVLAAVTVTTPEGSESRTTAIVVTPTPDVNITGTITGTETDSDVTLVLSDFINLAIDPDNETLFSLNLTLPGLPFGTQAVDASGNPVGSLVADGTGTFTFSFEYDVNSGSTVELDDVRLVFPADFSTQNPDIPLAATLLVSTVTGNFSPSSPVTATIDVVIAPEGDVALTVVGAAVLQETDAPLDFKPSDYLTASPTDADGSESIDTISVSFNDLPPGTLFSVQGGAFQAAPVDNTFTGSASDYDSLIVRLPADFSTQSPGTTVTGTVTATTDEFGVATGAFDVTVEAEGDLTIIGTGALVLFENDAPGVIDLDNTTQAALVVRLADAATVVIDDADMSETITQITVRLSDLPNGAELSFDAGIGFAPVSGDVIFTRDTLFDFENVLVRLPADFSTDRPEGAITGTFTFQTDEAVLNTEILDTPNSGFLSQAISIDVLAEGDVRIDGSNLVVAEDTGTPVDLGLAGVITDVDGSETLSAVTVTFDGLPAVGQTVLSDGTILSGIPGANVWAGAALSDLSGLSVASFPQHFSGIVTMTTTVVTSETGPAGQSATFVLAVTPVAEPEITLTVDASETAVTEIAAGQFSVKEDNSFVLQISATTADQDGSETLRDIVVENMPQGWLRAGDGAVDLALFEAGSADIASATVTGSTLTLTLNAGVTTFNGDLRVTPLADADSDVDTLTGGDFQATVTAVDTAAGLASNIGTASDSVDLDVDAVVDGIDFAFRNRGAIENLGGRRIIDAGITRLGLEDTDGSEVFDAVTFTVTVDTLSDDFDAADPTKLALNFRGRDAFVSVIKSDNIAGDNAVTFTLLRPDGVSSADFARAITGLRLDLPENFSGRATLEGDISWSETQTGDAEADTSDNATSQPFTTVLTVRPIAEATLDAGVFVRNSDFVNADSPLSATTEVIAQRNDQSVVNSDTITLQESTSDSSGFGQVQAFLKLGASTPDLDGSEALRNLVVSNIPSSWIGIAETTQNVVLDRSMFFTLDGSAQISQAEFDKLASAFYDAGTGELTLTFAPDVESFNGSVAVYPAVYEDYDVDRANGDRFRDDGTFFGADLSFALTAVDGNTVTTADVDAALTVDVDVDPINNEAFVLAFPVGNEAVIDAAGGVFQFDFIPLIRDVDGSEAIISTVLRNVPDFLTVYAPPPNDPDGVKVPALLTRINGDGTLNWSLNQDQWLGVELRGVPLHFADDFPILVDIVTREANGTRGVTQLTSVTISIDPVVDGGNPSERFATREDTAVQVVLDGNIIDRTPESPEIVLDGYKIFDVDADSEGRTPQFFDGVPNQVTTTPSGDPVYDNLLSPNAAGEYDIDAVLAGNLFVLPGKDSNENVVFRVEMTYQEQNDPSQTREDVGTVTIAVQGVADTPVLGGQNADPAATPGGVDKALIDTIYTAGGASDADRTYAYAGFDDVPFQLTQRLSDAALQTDFSTLADPFTSADLLTGDRTEITFADSDPDGSETIYYIITGIPVDSVTNNPAIRFLGGTPVDSTGETYLVTGEQLANLTVISSPVADVTYYDLKLNAFVIENDQDLSGVSQIGAGVSVEDVLIEINDLTGGSLTTTDFSIMVLPSGNPGGGGMVCPPDDPRMLPIPELRFVGDAFEDTPNALQIAITENPPFWSSIADLSTLPNGVSGDFGFGLKLPAGATLTSTTQGAVVFDPISGEYAIDFARLGVDPANPLLTAGTVTYTPPPHQSSLGNPFSAGETFGSADPYDSLADIQTVSVLNNFTCNDFSSMPGSLPLVVLPVADGPSITISAPASVQEDSDASFDLTISSEDGGERLSGDVVVALDGDPGARLFRLGSEIAPDTGTGPGTGVPARFTLSPGDITGLSLRATEHFSGQIGIAVTAVSEDIDGSTASSTATRTVTIVPVADQAQFVYNSDNTILAGTGVPLVTDPTGPLPIVTVVEDTRGIFGQIFTIAGSPDQDGSETESAVIGPLPDYVQLTGAAGIIDNGDGTYTVPARNLGSLEISLVDTHARTPDGLDPDILAEIPVTVTINSLELANSDQAEGSTQFLLRVYPDADKPDVTAEVSPVSGAEDDGTLYQITVTGSTLDPHETLSFEITLPVGSTLFIGGVAQPDAPDGTYIVPGIPNAAFAGAGAGFVPDGALRFTSPPDLAGDLVVDVVAISTDTSATYGTSDTERSDVDASTITLVATPDLILSSTATLVTLDETDAAVSFKPIDTLTFSLLDGDGSEQFTSLDFELTGLPAGATYDVGLGPVPVSGTLSLALTEAELRDLQITLPADFASAPGRLQATVSATTNEGGDETAQFEVLITGELDATLSVSAPPSLVEQEGSSLVLPIDITAQLTDSQPVPSEVWQRVTISFANPLPAATVLSVGVLAADGLSILFEPGALTAADFEASLAAFTMTLPDGFDGVIDGTVIAETNHGTTPPQVFTVDVNARPDVSGPLDLGPFDSTASFSLNFADLLANAADSDARSIENLGTSDPDVQISVNGTDITITVPDGYAGTPELVYDVVDDAPDAARTQARATLDIDTLQAVPDPGTPLQQPPNAANVLLDDVTGDAAFGTVAKGTDTADYVEASNVRPYAGITEFQLMDGDDVFNDFRLASGSGFTVDGGAGNDQLTGSSSGPSMTFLGGAGNDTLVAGAGDRLEGGIGVDTLVGSGLAGTVETFVLTGGSMVVASVSETDSIMLYGSEDIIDLSQEVSGLDDISGLVTYDDTRGNLNVNGQNAFQISDAGGGLPAQVSVMFEDSAGAAQIAVV